uniref:Growth arrest-specific protein 7-like n=1 Tax=Sinocyclocheilus anshuiensis TaxID=1608454 RepID=A0A671R508_9TELE
MSGSFCRSLYSFNGDQHQQGLKFEAGEVIRITQALDGGWWEGEKDGVKGWFPSTYVQLLPMWRLLSITSQQKKTDDVINRKWLDFALVFPETTWERPSSTPGTPKTPVKHKNSVPTGGEHQHLYIIQIGEKLQKNINCVTFPFPLHMSEQQLLKPDEWSYCDYFWADRKDPQGSANISGFEVLLQKQLKGRQMQKEMAEFVRERIRIEEEYAKNLSKLSQIPLAAQEEGTLGEAWAQLKISLADEAEVHLKFSSKLQSEVEKPLLIFRENFKKDMKKFDHHMADLRKQLTGRNSAVEKARKALADRQKDLELKTQQLEIKLSSKIEEDIKKARRKSTQAGDDLMRCVDLYNQSQSKWFEEMVTSSLELERLEVERVEMIRQHLCQYTTLRHETDMFNQSTIEPVDKLLRSVDPAKDRELWVKEHKTGELRPVDMDI